MPTELKNYLRLERFSLCHRFYAFLDSSDYLADQLFIKHKVRVKFLQEYQKDGFDLRTIFCRIHKRDEGAFLDALNELSNKMMLCGHVDYPAQCRAFMEMIDTARKEGECA
ncbi:hypothetical protein SDC9_43462 [bioreactor metagenome]|uniref:Uncharacterized protein n=1 Tax=bioreactor metagenome TaxID=1076179 RepID=A0A644W496_9ZZZZ|nr:hypothetical protein [Clostridia bacterium]